MNQLLKVLVIAFAGLSVSACTTTGVGVSSERGTHVQYIDAIAGKKTEINYLVHPDMVRIDYGATGNYTLFDRRTLTIYDINEQEQTVKVIRGTVPALTAEELGVTITSSPSQLTNNGSSVHYRFIKNNETCYNAVVLETFLPTIDQALTELAAVRANDPRFADLEPNSCQYIKTHLVDRLVPSYGTPARLWSNYGYSRFINNFETQLDLTENQEWYRLPEWYKPSAK